MHFTSATMEAPNGLIFDFIMGRQEVLSFLSSEEPDQWLVDAFNIEIPNMLLWEHLRPIGSFKGASVTIESEWSSQARAFQTHGRLSISLHYTRTVFPPPGEVQI